MKRRVGRHMDVTLKQTWYISGIKVCIEANSTNGGSTADNFRVRYFLIKKPCNALGDGTRVRFAKTFFIDKYIKSTHLYFLWYKTGKNTRQHRKNVSENNLLIAEWLSGNILRVQRNVTYSSWFRKCFL